MLIIVFTYKKTMAQDTTSLNGVEITAKERNISLTKTLNITTINAGNLQQAACCNLSESFEQNASVSVSMADGATGALRLNFLGLDGVYTQLMAENVPTLRGLATGFGLGYVPGSWIQSIQISKGVGSVVNGYEGNVGSINIEFLKPNSAPRYFVNVFLAHTGRVELNAHFVPKAKKRWTSLNLLHAEALTRRLDMNHDRFLDDPRSQQIHVFSRYKYEGNRLKAQFGIRALTEGRQGGQVGFGLQNPYLIGINSQRVEAFCKTGIVYPLQPYKGLGFVNSVVFHAQSAVYGKTDFDVRQWSYYNNFVYQNIIGNTKHKYKLGVNTNYDNFVEKYNSAKLQLFNKKNINLSSGIYTEYTFNPNPKLDVVAGLRTDYIAHYGFFPTPRLHLKYNIKPNIALRLSGGRAFRWAQPLIENQQFLVSSRQLVADAPQFAEISWNYGGNYTQVFALAQNREATLSIDAYRTQFEQQMVADFEVPEQVLFYSLRKKSYANSFQAELNTELTERMELKLAYKFEDTRIAYKSRNELNAYKIKPLFARHTGLFVLHYATKYNKWQADFTTRYTGGKRLPLFVGEVNEWWSPGFFTHNLQVTRRFLQIEYYVGSENLFNFSVMHAINQANAPFDAGFDATAVWGPVFGRRVYAGLRYTRK